MFPAKIPRSLAKTFSASAQSFSASMDFLEVYFSNRELKAAFGLRVDLLYNHFIEQRPNATRSVQSNLSFLKNF